MKYLPLATMCSCFVFLSFNLNALQEGEILDTALGFKRHPLVGRYHPSLYQLADVETVFRLDRQQFGAFPHPIQERFEFYTEEELDLFLIVLSDDELRTGNSRRNLLFHHCAFPEAPLGESHSIQLTAGIFSPFGIKPDRTTEAIPFDRFGQQPLSIHPVGADTAFSPNNCRFLFGNESPIASFFTAAELPDHRAVAAFIILYKNSENRYGKLLKKASSKANAYDFFTSLVGSELPGEVLEPLMAIFSRMWE